MRLFFFQIETTDMTTENSLTFFSPDVVAAVNAMYKTYVLRRRNNVSKAAASVVGWGSFGTIALNAHHVTAGKLIKLGVLEHTSTPVNRQLRVLDIHYKFNPQRIKTLRDFFNKETFALCGKTQTKSRLVSGMYILYTKPNERLCRKIRAMIDTYSHTDLFAVDRTVSPLVVTITDAGKTFIEEWIAMSDLLNTWCVGGYKSDLL